MGRKRLDDLLVEKGLAGDRKEAAARILSGVVLVDSQRQEKAGTLVETSSQIRLKGTPNRFVSRGGWKLEGALKAFQLDVSGLVCLDLGASTGGFTDCLLQKGARKVYAFDVGRGQLDWSLQQDPRVAIRDGVNVRYLDRSQVQERVDLITADLSFISLRHVLSALKQFAGARILVLVKPQFEAKREEVSAGGLIPSEEKSLEIVRRVRTFMEEQGFHIAGQAPSPIRGRKGNREYFLLVVGGW